MNTDSDAQVYESMALARDLKEAQGVEQIKTDVLRNNLPSAFLNFEKVEKNLNQIAQTKQSSDTDDELKRKGAEIKESINKLTTYPSTTVLIQVLKEKIYKFQLFVVGNHWPTLARISDKMLQASHNLSPINFDANSRILRSLQADILSIREVSERSALSLENKALINLRLKSVEAELKMLSDFIDDQRSFLATHEKYKKSFEVWINSVIPELALRKNSISSYSKDFLQYLLGLGGACVFLIGIGALLSRYLTRKEDKEGALALKEMIEGHLIVNHYRGNPNFSPELDKVLSSYHHYFQKRMNLGLLFQESLPVPAIVIDSNYKISWANKSFIEAWDLDENDVRDEKLSWDFVKRFTNLDSLDPVSSALKEKVAGIFDIKLQTTLNGNFVPYEMFVTPVDSNSGNKAVAYFYPMTKHAEAIESILNELIEPIDESIIHLLNGGIPANQADFLHSKFKENRVSPTFEKLMQLNSVIQNTNDSYLSRIRELEKNMEDQIQEVQEANFQKLELLKYNKSLQLKMKSLRDHVIKQSEEFHSFGEKLEHLQVASTVLTNDSLAMKSMNDEMLRGLKEHSAPIMEMVKVKDAFKGLKDELMLSRNKVMSYFDQVQMFERTQNLLDQERLGQLMNRLKREMIELDKNLMATDKRMRDLDVHLSKAEILTVDVVNKVRAHAPNLNEKGQQVREDIALVFDECRELSSEIGRLEIIMIHDFEEIYSLLKKARSFDESKLVLETSSGRPRELSTM
ncbi:MAG: hypothetical protein ACOYL6_12415 [Bacteriovoracaceae bacterium]